MEHETRFVEQQITGFISRFNVAVSMETLSRNDFIQTASLENDFGNRYDIPDKPLQDLRRMDHLACSPQLLRSAGRPAASRSLTASSWA